MIISTANYIEKRVEKRKMKFEIANKQDPELKWNEIDSITYYKLLDSKFSTADGKEKGARGTMLIVIDVSMPFYKILLDQSAHNFSKIAEKCEALRYLCEVNSEYL